MWQVLEVLARLMCLGAFVLFGVTVWLGFKTPNYSRGCIECSRSLATYDLVTCSDCLGVFNA